MWEKNWGMYQRFSEIWTSQGAAGTTNQDQENGTESVAACPGWWLGGIPVWRGTAVQGTGTKIWTLPHFRIGIGFLNYLLFDPILQKIFCDQNLLETPPRWHATILHNP